MKKKKKGKYYQRPGRSGYTFQARTATGWEQMGTGTTNEDLSGRIVEMWETLAQEYRAWDILNPILDSGRLRPKRLLALYDIWMATKKNLTETRRRLNDLDIEPLVEEYMALYTQRGGLESTIVYTLAHLRFLLPIGVRCPASTITEDVLTKRLSEYMGKDRQGKLVVVKPSMRRKVHSSWSGFFDYLVRPKRIYDQSPMTYVKRPVASKQPIRFYGLDVVQTIVDAQPTVERKAIFALMYGTGLEPIVVLGRNTGSHILPPLTRADFDEDKYEVRAAGTKEHTRDRIALIAEWARPYVNKYLRTMLPTVPLFQQDRSTVTHWHLKTIRDLKLPIEYPLYGARHHWAARQLRAGTPVAGVQQQLGHSTAKETLDTYGAFVPSGADREKWERLATRDDKRRKRANKPQ